MDLPAGEDAPELRHVIALEAFLARPAAAGRTIALRSGAPTRPRRSSARAGSQVNALADPFEARVLAVVDGLQRAEKQERGRIAARYRSRSAASKARAEVRVRVL